MFRKIMPVATEIKMYNDPWKRKQMLGFQKERDPIGPNWGYLNICISVIYCSSVFDNDLILNSLRPQGNLFQKNIQGYLMHVTVTIFDKKKKEKERGPGLKGEALKHLNIIILHPISM